MTCRPCRMPLVQSDTAATQSDLPPVGSFHPQLSSRFTHVYVLSVSADEPIIDRQATHRYRHLLCCFHIKTPWCSGLSCETRYTNMLREKQCTYSSILAWVSFWQGYHIFSHLPIKVNKIITVVAITRPVPLTQHSESLTRRSTPGLDRHRGVWAVPFWGWSKGCLAVPQQLRLRPGLIQATCRQTWLVPTAVGLYKAVFLLSLMPWGSLVGTNTIQSWDSRNWLHRSHYPLPQERRWMDEVGWTLESSCNDAGTRCFFSHHSNPCSWNTIWCVPSFDDIPSSVNLCQRQAPQLPSVLLLCNLSKVSLCPICQINDLKSYIVVYSRPITVCLLYWLWPVALVMHAGLAEWCMLVWLSGFNSGH